MEKETTMNVGAKQTDNPFINIAQGKENMYNWIKESEKIKNFISDQNWSTRADHSKMLETTEKYYITLADVKMLYDYKLQYLLRDESQMRGVLYQGNEKSENLKMICEIFGGEYGRDNKMFEILHLIDTNTLKQIHEARLTYEDRNRKQLNYFEDLVLKQLKK